MSKPSMTKTEKTEKPAKRPRRSGVDSELPERPAKSEREAKKSKPSMGNDDAPREKEKVQSSRPTISSLLGIEEKSFPRGGASILTPIEKKQIQIQADRDALFEEGSGKKRSLPADISGVEDDETFDRSESKPKKKRRTKETHKDDVVPAEEKVERIEGLSFRKLVPGSLVLGQVQQITRRDITLALPHGLVGFVPLTNISRQLTSRVEKLLEEADKEDSDEEAEEDGFEDVDIKKMFKIGQWLRASVTSNEEIRGGKVKKHLSLSIDPRLANAGLTQEDLVSKATVQASVASVEDGGLVMDLGVDGNTAKGFLSANELGVGVKHSNIQEGAVLLCLITGQSGNGRVVKLTADPTKMGDTKKGSSLTSAPSIKTFMPGTVASVLISEVMSAGIKGSIMGLLNVTADFIHAGGAQGKAESGLEKKHKAGEKIDARILYSIHRDETQKVGVSIIDHVLKLSSKSLDNKKGQPPLEQLAMSATVEEARVVKVEPRKGIYLDVGVPRVHALAHISQLTEDKQVDTLPEDTGPYKVGSVHRVRVIGFSQIDGLFSVTLKESVLDEIFLRIEDVQVGETIEGTIEDLPVKPDGIAGIRLKLAESIRGFVPVDHISDTRLKHPERKYRVGMKVKARVLSVNLEKRSIYLTMKKSLVGSEVEAWTSYKDLKEGMHSPGTITKLQDTGAWVQFYGSVRGFLPVREMSEAFIKNPAEHFRVGQVVNVHIISLEQEKRRMLLSCKDPGNQSGNEARQKAFDVLTVGQIVDGTVIELGNELVTVELEGSVQGFLKVLHLTDGSDKKNASTLAKMRVGMKVTGLVVLQKVKGSKSVRISNKPSLVLAAKEGVLPTNLAQLQLGKVVRGFVSSVTITGVFVEFGDNLTGLIPLSGMSDDMRRARMRDFGVVAGQSITARVWNVFPEDKKFTLTVREEEVIAPRENGTSKTGTAPTLERPIDEKLASIDELVVGKQTLVRVNAVKDLQLNVSLADNVSGRIHATEMFNKWEEIVDPKQPLKHVKHNTTLAVTVIGLHEAKTSKFLPLSHRSSVQPVIECSHKQAETAEPVILSTLKLNVGEECIAFITKYSSSFALAALSPEVSGTIGIAQLANEDTEYAKAFPVGCAVRVTIKSVDVAKNKVRLSLLGAKKAQDKNFETGSVHVGHVRRQYNEGVDVQLSKSVWGFVPLTELNDDYEQARPESWTAKASIKVKILTNSGGKERLLLSARSSLTSPSAETSNNAVQDRHIAGNGDVKVGEVVRGFVKAISKQGMLVRIGWNTIAQIPVHELADEFIKSFETKFKSGQLVRGKVIKADAGEEGHHKMSLRKSVVENDEYKPELGFGDLSVGDIVEAVVVKVEKYGVFIKIKGSKNVRGLCHVSELASERVEDPSKLYSEGDNVKAKIIRVDQAKRNVNFSLKASHFQESNAEEAAEEEIDQKSEDEDEEMGGVGLEDEQDVENGENEGVELQDEEMDDAPQQSATTKKQSAASGLKTAGFDWTGAVTKGDDATLLSDTEQVAPKKRRKKAEIQVDKTGDLDALGPQSVSDFERLLLGQPNSSALWIQYMAFQLGLSEVDKAREVAERALKTIHMREEEEKLNVWVALLNLENVYGNEEGVENVFERACGMSDRKTVFLRLASIFIESGKHKQAEELFERMRKNKDISSDPTYWLNYATFLMTTLARPDDARALLARATQILPTHTHSQTISRFGALEYSSPHGDIERGRTIFEGLIDAHKNGHDLWDQYLAQEISLVNNGKEGGDVESVRKLFERMSKMKMKPKRAKYVFKKWLSWEREVVAQGKGGDENLAKVKALAEEWVEQNGGKGLDV